MELERKRESTAFYENFMDLESINCDLSGMNTRLLQTKSLSFMLARGLCQISQVFVFISSNYHIEVCPADAGIHDRVVIQELVKNIAGGQSLNNDKQKQFKVIVITEANRLTKDAQHGLRRTMEKYMSTCRMILLSESTSKLIPALRSRCLGIRVQAPSTEEVKQCLMQACEVERFEMSDEQMNRIVKRKYCI